MYPGCRFMDMHPRERDHISYAPHHGPGFGYVPSHMKMDTARSPVNYESVPCYGSYGCPYPLPYHGCYHNQIPDHHGYGLHYPYYAPPPPVYCNGTYPPFPGGYPFQYLPSPSPHYSVADPRFEYDKKGPADHHCCGCPNHSCQQKENKNVKIEEQTSDGEKDNVASVVSPELKNQPYRVLWIPPGYNRNEEGEQTVKPESKKVSSFDNEAKGNLKPCAQDVWNGWLPIDLNNLNSLVQGKDEKGIEHQQNGDSKSSCAEGCVPSYPEQKDKLELNDGGKSAWDPSQYRIFPLKLIENQDEKSMPDGDVKKIVNSSSEGGPKTRDKNVVKKIIPVKQMDRSEEKVLLKNNQTEQKRESKVEKNQNVMPLKLTDKKGEKEHLENNHNVQSSLSKASKLPPVCLRVDPLPRRRTKGGSSRSPSPPANKTKSEIVSHDKSSSSSTTQGNNQHDMQSSADSDLSRLQSGKRVKDIEVADSILRHNKVEAQKEDLSQSLVNASAGDSQERVSSGCQDEKGVNSDQEFFRGDGVKIVDKLSGEIVKDDKLTIEAQSGDVKCETGTEGGPIDTKKLEQARSSEAPNQKFSEAEAAVIIQSAYRGFEVRRWEPLKKLKEIAKIEGEMNKVSLHIQSLVSSGSGNIDKQKIVIGETIMNLLLQLDTMQGLHPSIRNIRKSVAKGLVSLQEKLDSITSQNSEELKESDISKHAGEIFKRASEEERQAGEDRHEQDTTSPGHMKFGVVGLCQDQPHSLMDMNTSSVDVEKSGPLPGTDEMGRAPEETQQASSGYVGSNWQHMDPLLEVKEPSEVHGVREDHDSFLVELKELPPVIVEEKLNPVAELQNLSSLINSDWSGKEDEAAKVNTGVPPRLPDQNSNAQVSGEGLQIDGRRCIVEPGNIELSQESGPISLGNKAKETSAEAQETSAEEEQHTKLPAEYLKSSDLEDNNSPAVCLESSESEGSSELKYNISAEGDSERDKEFSGDDMLGTELVEASNKTCVNNNEGESNVCVVERDGRLTDGRSIYDRRTAAAGVDTKEISDIKEVANACEVEVEGDDKPGDDMHSVGVEMKERPDVKEAVNVCEVEGDDMLVDDMQIADTVGLEQRETPEVNKFGKDAGTVEDRRSIETCRPELEDLSKTTSDVQVKQQLPSFTRDTIANCISGQKLAVGEDQEMWEDKFDNKEIYEKHGIGNMINLPKDEDLVEEERATETVKKQPQKEFSTGEELIFEKPGKESDEGLVEENEKLKETVKRLIAAGEEQLNAISSLSERMKDLEKKLSRKKKLRLRRQKAPSRYLLQV